MFLNWMIRVAAVHSAGQPVVRTIIQARRSALGQTRGVSVLLLPVSPLVVCLAISLTPAPVRSQTVGERLDAFWARVGQMTNLDSLQALDMTVTASAEDERELLVKTGLVALRRYELSLGKVEYKKAVDAFEEGAERYRSFAWAYYSLGMAYARGPEVWIPESRGYRHRMVHVLSLAERRARRALLRAVELDPGMAAAALELASLAMASRRRPTLETARQTLVRVAGQADSDAAVWVALADVEAALGNLGAGIAATDEALARDPHNASAFHAMADALFRQPGQEAVAADAYFIGVDYLTPDAAARYYEDLLPILSAEEIVEWTSASLEERREWLRRYWGLKAAICGVRVSERLAAHYRRLQIAHEAYRRLGTRGAPPENALLLGLKRRKLPFDDRGLILIRHGLPDEVVRTPGPNLPPNETWAYLRRDDLPRTLDFLKGKSRPDLTLARLLTCKSEYSPGASPEDRIRVQWTGDDDIRQFIRYYEDRARFDGRYQLFAMRCENAIQRLTKAALDRTTRSDREARTPDLSQDSISRVHEAYAQVRTLQTRGLELDAWGRLSAESALDHDTYVPDFSEDLPFIYRFYAFRSGGEGSEILAASLFPAERLQPRTVNAQVVYSLDVSFIVADSISGSVYRADTVLHFWAPQQLEAEAFIRAHLRVAAKPSVSTFYRLAGRDGNAPERGQIYGGPITVPDLSRRRIQLSDLVLAEEGKGPWRRGGVGLALRPTHLFRVGERLVLYYEIYDLPTGAPYRTEIMVKPARSGSLWSFLGRFLGIQLPGAITLRFEGLAESPVAFGLEELRTLSGSLLPGEYTVRVTVTNLERLESTTAETRLVVVE